MKFFRGLLTAFLIIVIVSGAGYLIFSYIGRGSSISMIMGNTSTDKMPMDKTSTEKMPAIENGNMSKGSSNNNVDNTNKSGNVKQNSTNANSGNMGMSGDSMSVKTEENSLVILSKRISTEAVLNREKLNTVLNMINEAMTKITIDPYAKVTKPGQNKINGIEESIVKGGNTTVNVYPNSQATNQNPSTITPNMKNDNYMVYNQGKLETVHNGIFKLAQGMMLLNELNDNLSMQASLGNYQSQAALFNRYSELEQNKNKLNRSLSLINEATVLINVNPYTDMNGYSYDTDKMAELHKGIYKLAEGMLIGTNLSKDFTNQMINIYGDFNMMGKTMNNNSMNFMNSNSFMNFGNMGFKTITGIVLVVFIIIFVIAIFGVVKNMFKSSGSR